MKCMTRDFGEIEITENEIITFIQPPFGFEDYKKYTFIYDNQIGNHIVWLQSTEEPAVCFILFDPSPLADFYKPEIPKQTEDLLGEGELLCWTIGVIPKNPKEATVNLKSPIIVNMEKNCGVQVILEQDYPIRFPLVKGE